MTKAQPKSETRQKPGPKPELFNDENRKAIIGAVSIGQSCEAAAKSVGINSGNIVHEKKRNPEFAKAIEDAEGKCERHHLDRIHKAENRWQASAWMLERKWPHRWAQRRAQESGELTPADFHGKPIVIERTVVRANGKQAKGDT